MSDPIRRELEPGLNEATVTLRNVELYEAGKYDGKQATDEAFIDALVQNWNPSEDRAPVTLDHAEEGPAYGWIGEIAKVGKKIIGDLTDVPASFAEAIKKNRYRTKSIEFFRNFLGTGKPKIAGLSFLGAIPPAVPTLADVKMKAALKPIAFADSSPREKLESASRKEIHGAIPADPNPGSHGTICCEDRTGETLGHFHEVHLDEAGSGFSGYPRKYTDGPYGYDVEEDGGGHIHIITEGECMPAEAEGVPSHVHPLTLIKSTNKNSKETEAMPEPVKTAEEQPEKYAALEKKLSEQDAEIERLRKENHARAESEAEATFEKHWLEAARDGHVADPTKNDDKRTYDTLRAAPVVEKYAKETVAPAIAFLQSLKKRPKLVMKAVELNKSGETGYSREHADEKPFEVKRYELTQEKIKAGMEPKQAFSAASKELLGVAE